jgi:oligopeptidase B
MRELATPPVAPRVPSVRELHGETVTDDYAWMRNADQQGLHAYLTAERAYYDAHTGDLNALAERLAAEAAGRIPDGPGTRSPGREADSRTAR